MSSPPSQKKWLGIKRVHEVFKFIARTVASHFRRVNVGGQDGLTCLATPK